VIDEVLLPSRKALVGISIGGVVLFTSIDYPGHLAAVIFCQGCGWRCSYCHNPHLQPITQDRNSWEEVKCLLQERKGFLDGVVFSGGEPLLQTNLKDAILDARDMGFKVAVHTGGAVPRKFAEILPFVDWVGFDVKAPFDRYHEVTKIKDSGLQAKQSLKMLLESGIEYEVRTTIAVDVFTHEYLLKISEELAALGVRTFVLQAFRSEKRGLDSMIEQKNLFFNNAILMKELGSRFTNFFVRGL